MTDKQLDILVNIIGGVESGGQVYGNRRYDAYVPAYKNSPEEHTCTLGWCQFYGNNARELCQRIFNEDKELFRKNNTANIEKRLSQDWVAIKWNPSASEKSALLKIITTDVGKKVQDEMFKEDMQAFIKDAETFGITDVGAQMMYCEIRHLGGKSPTERIFKRANKPYTADSIYASLLLDQNDTSNNNQVGDKKYQSRHQKCVEWIHTYVCSNFENKTETNKEGDNMTVSKYIQLVVDVATNEIGYMEKRSNSNLDSKDLNVGSANYTKYGRDMHNLYPSVMDFPAAWCDAFCDWCFYKAYGVSTAKSLLGGNFDDYTVTSAQLYKNKGAWYTSNPQIGDQIFFTNASGGICHTGLVIGITSTTVITIEGNTSSASGVVANGGMVAKKTYNLTYSRIAGYGRPAYAKFCANGIINSSQSTSAKPSTSTSTSSASSSFKLNETIKWTGITTDVLNVRKWAGTKYDTCSFSPLKKGTEVGVCDVVKASDGSDWYYIKYQGKTGFVSGKYVKKTSSTTTSASTTYSKTQFVKDVQSVIGATVDGIAGTQTLSLVPTISKIQNNRHAVVIPLQKYLNSIGYNVGNVDGWFGDLCDDGIRSYQEDNGLVVDRIIGQKTWRKLLA